MTIEDKQSDLLIRRDNVLNRLEDETSEIFQFEGLNDQLNWMNIQFIEAYELDDDQLYDILSKMSTIVDEMEMLL